KLGEDCKVKTSCQKSSRVSNSKTESKSRPKPNPPLDSRRHPKSAIAEAVAGGVNHIDTSDFYGPHVTNQIIREALHPYPDDLVIVTKISVRRGEDGSWHPAFSREELTQAVHDNLRNLGLDVLDVVNLRSMFDVHGPAEGSI